MRLAHPSFTHPVVSNGLGLLSRLLKGTGADRAMLAGQTVLYRARYIRAVIYHDTPARFAQHLTQQLAFYRDHFSSVSEPELEAFLKTGEWQKSKPGLILTFDDGLKNNHDVAAPLLEHFGFTGWFFVPTDFVDTPDKQQPAYAREHRIGKDQDPSKEGRLALSWDEVRTLARQHVVGCHTRSHRRLGAALSDAELHGEIVESKRILESRLGHPVRSFCWVGGEETSYSPRAARHIATAGYRLSFMTNSAPIRPATHPLQLQRTHVEAEWPVDLIRFQLCGVIDLLYTPKRRRVTRLTRC